MPTIGFLGAALPSNWGQWVAAFVQRLRELGWSEGRTIAIEYRWAEGRSERYAEIAAEFVRRNVDVIVTSGVAALAAKQATPSSRLCSLWPPIRLAPGWSRAWRDRAAILPACPLNLPIPVARARLLREAVPGLRRLAILANAG